MIRRRDPGHFGKFAYSSLFEERFVDFAKFSSSCYVRVALNNLTPQLTNKRARLLLLIDLTRATRDCQNR